MRVRRDRSFFRTEDELFCGDVSGATRFDDVASDLFVATDELVESLVASSVRRCSLPSKTGDSPLVGISVFIMHNNPLGRAQM
jgi:hypothetical protein